MSWFIALVVFVIASFVCAWVACEWLMRKSRSSQSSDDRQAR